MTPLRSQFMDALRVKGYSEKTVTSYVHCILDAVKLYRISPLLFTSDQIQKYLLVLIQQRKLAPGTVNLRINALKTFYKLMAPGSRLHGHGRLHPDENAPPHSHGAIASGDRPHDCRG